MIDLSPNDDQLCGDCSAVIGDEQHAEDCQNYERPQSTGEKLEEYRQHCAAVLQIDEDAELVTFSEYKERT